MSASPAEAPVTNWVDVAQLVDDPYPTYQRLRAEAPVAYVPALRRYLVTTYPECLAIQRDEATFSAAEDKATSTMIAAMGRSMLRKDDPEHKTDRQPMNAVVSRRAVKTVWEPVFAHHADTHLRRLRALGPGADLFAEFAVPFAADNLTALLGLRDVEAATLANWSQTLIAGIGNVTGDPEVWRETARVRAEIDAAIDEAVSRLRRAPDGTIISALLHAPHPVSEESLRTNVRLAISGGMNEPSHVIASAVWCLTVCPDQLELVRAGEHTWGDVFEETIRLQSPVGMYPRRVTRDTELRGVRVPSGATVGVVIASANRDADQFAHPDRFDLTRGKTGHLAFGTGVHICLGNWAARSMVGDVALPVLYEALPGLRVTEAGSTPFRGWVFRGCTELPVWWD